MCIVSFCITYQLSRPHNYFTIRSALTDAPVVSFTTPRLSATQHTTGLMVKVALLLPSGGLPSSQSQLRWTHTAGLPKYGQTEVIFNFFFRYYASYPARHYLFSFLLLSSTSVFQSSSVPG